MSDATTPAAPPRAAGGTNVPEYTVAELSGAVKRTLEGTFGRVRVRGEVTECRPYGANRFYFSLKDEGGQLRAVIWAWSAGRSGVKPENGTEVIATGKITAYGDRSTYQIVVDRLDYAGEGALLARVEKLRKALEAEGLFAEERKRPLPFLPAVIGVVTSAQGAVIQDIRTTLLRRFPSRIILWPVAVQGPGSAEQVAAAIAGFNALPGGFPRPEVLIVARGGGSLEDLMAFNEEVVVRAAAASAIPLISAVGHETDTTLIDFAADRRAPTPTAAAELAMPARAELLEQVQQRALRLTRAGQSVMDAARYRLARAAAELPDLPGMLLNARQRLDDRGERLALAPRALLQRQRGRLNDLAARLVHPREQVTAHRAALALLDARARGAVARIVEARRARLAAAATRLPHPREGVAARRAALALLDNRARAAALRAVDRQARAFARLPEPLPRLEARLREARLALEGLSARLEGASYQGLLARGFALVRDASGAPVTRAAAVTPGQRLRIEFGDGGVEVVEARGSRAARGGPAARGVDQGSLL
ncbi:exodeoxyribonuclease VII large subunit [Roseomonas sp. OT10]|uniref:exodeoxyribonuclease VII large subunit n=1 Tax=Roseomonas cutis TaxID=2897332 RepID=UPI001E2CE513|nr:exodeoxyribonuclease VII large subunit [Roseomonas sp. OT10]UFN47559.1 exodeoxyribonuclease VII large subunit [Roseomonas sp. OT10]